MKKILLIVLVLIVGCAKEVAKEPEPINIETLDERDEVGYTKDTNKPYTGAVFDLHKSGEKRQEFYLKDGKADGKWKKYYRNGQIMGEGNWKDGIQDGKWTDYNKDGSIARVEEYKDGKKVK